MSAVATKPRPTATAPVTGLEARLAKLRTALALGFEKVDLAYEAAEEGSASETLLRRTREDMSDAIALLQVTHLTKVDVGDAYEAFFVPLATIEGVIALSSGSVIEHTLREAHAVLDAAHTELDSCGELANLLPQAGSKEPSTLDIDNGDTAEARRDLACEANFEISKLAEAVKRLMAGEEDQPIFNGIMGRIELLSDLVHHVMRLDGGSDEQISRPALRTLQAWYEGRPA